MHRSVCAISLSDYLFVLFISAFNIYIQKRGPKQYSECFPGLFYRTAFQLSKSDILSRFNRIIPLQIHWERHPVICSGLGLRLMKKGDWWSPCFFVFSLHAVVIIKSSLKPSPLLPVLSLQASNSNQQFPNKSYVSCITTYIGNPFQKPCIFSIEINLRVRHTVWVRSFHSLFTASLCLPGVTCLCQPVVHDPKGPNTPRETIMAWAATDCPGISIGRFRQLFLHDG